MGHGGSYRRRLAPRGGDLVTSDHARAALVTGQIFFVNVVNGKNPLLTRESPDTTMQGSGVFRECPHLS
jgi:hypothetical protein